jgi:hypothetical protein
LALLIEGIPRLLSGSVTVDAPTTPPPTTTTGAANAVLPTPVDLPLIIGVSLGAVAFLLLVILVSVVCYQRHTKRETPAKALSQHPREMESAQEYEQAPIFTMTAGAGTLYEQVPVSPGVYDVGRL